MSTITQTPTKISIKGQDEREISPIKKCSNCDHDKNNVIYIPGYGYISYCSPSCFRQTQ